MLHKSVLLDESISQLNIHDGGIYVDATLGYGGHSQEILKRNKTGFLFCFDQDIEAINYSTSRLKGYHNYEIINSNFSQLTEELNKRGINKIDGILYDIGVSSMQLDEDYRGFSYHTNARLDMRMDTSSKFSAYELVNSYDYDNLVRVIRDYGEEVYAKSIAKNIIAARVIKPIETTFDLVDIIKSSMPEKAKRNKHPARKTFQAIRIEVNNELEVLKTSLEQAINLLNIGGRISIITFHSLEDRIVKQIFKTYSSVPAELNSLPVVPDAYLPKIKIISHGITPTDEEINTNYRSRSARLRVIEKIRD